MRNIRGFALGIALGLATGLSTVGIAQNTKPADKKSESCCAMESCCCKGDSCSMKHETMGQAMKEHAKTHGSEHGCCCCSDSCNLEMKNKEKVN